MRKVEVVKRDEIEVKPFILDDFTQHQIAHKSMSKVTKKELKNLAKELDLAYDDTQIAFTKKLMNAYMEKR